MHTVSPCRGAAASHPRMIEPSVLRGEVPQRSAGSLGSSYEKVLPLALQQVSEVPSARSWWPVWCSPQQQVPPPTNLFPLARDTPVVHGRGRSACQPLCRSARRSEYSLEGSQPTRFRDPSRRPVLTGSVIGPAKPQVLQGPWGHVIGAVAVEGKVDGDLAELKVKLVITLAIEGPVWVPVRLDGQTLTGVREGDRYLASRVVEGGGWQVELSGPGNHSVRIDLLTPVRATPEGRTARASAIPESASTRVLGRCPLVPRLASLGRAR